MCWRQTIIGHKLAFKQLSFQKQVLMMPRLEAGVNLELAAVKTTTLSLRVTHHLSLPSRVRREHQMNLHMGKWEWRKRQILALKKYILVAVMPLKVLVKHHQKLEIVGRVQTQQVQLLVLRMDLVDIPKPC
jgi:hypothetical protein